MRAIVFGLLLMFSIQAALSPSGAAEPPSATPAAGVADPLPSSPQGQSWTIVWRDEFDGDHLDETKWTPLPDGPRKGGLWRPRAVHVDGHGHLVIRTFKDGDRHKGRAVSSERKFEHRHRFYMVRAKLYRQPGHWPAFWIMGRGVGTIGDGGRDGCEIDIVEKPWRDDRIGHALHWDGYGEHHQVASHTPHALGVMDGFHTYALWWKDDAYVFFVDGVETWRTAAGGVCRVPKYLMLSDEVGVWAGDIASAALPDEFVVD
jgi:beta-glucanase (GH16 family)